MEKCWEDLLPVYGIEENCILSKQGDYTAGYRVVGPEMFSLSETDYAGLHQSYVRAIRTLLPGFVVHQQDWYVRARHQGDGKEKSWLAEASDRFFEGRPYLQHDAYLFLTRTAPGRRKASSWASGLIFPPGVPKVSLDAKAHVEFEGICGQFVHILESSGLVRLERLDAAVLWSGREKTGLIERYCLLETGPVPMLKDIELGDSRGVGKVGSSSGGLRIGERHCALFTMGSAEELPGECGPSCHYSTYSTDRTKFSIGFASGLGVLLDCDHVCNSYVFIDSIGETVKQMEARRRKLQSLAAYSRENTASQEATDAFLNGVVGQQMLPVRYHGNVLVWSDQREGLPRIKNLTASALAQLGATPRIETVGAPQIWAAGIPGNAGDLPGNETCNLFAEQAVCFLPMETNYRSSGGGFGLRLGDRLSGRPLNVDIDGEPRAAGITGNGNMFVLSGSGGGKSFFTNHLVREYYDRAVHAVIVDVGHSYRAQCELHGGYYFTYEESDPIRFNPFYTLQSEGMDTEKKESLKTLLLALWKRSDESTNRAEYVALSNALQYYFDMLGSHWDVFPCFDSFYEFMGGEFRKRLERDGGTEKEFDLANFLYVLRPYYRDGEFSYLLNARENLELLEQRFIVFELDNIKDHPILFPVVTLIIMELFVSKMRKIEGAMKMIIIEEAWKPIASGGMAAYIKYLFKTVRKFNAKAVVVTQEVEDIISSEIIRNAIINNADIKVLLDQSKFQNKFGEIQELLGITEKQKAEILSINKGHEPGSRYKDLWIGLGAAHSRVYRLEVSPEEYYVYSSNQQDKLLVREYAGRWGSLREGITRLVADLRVGINGAGRLAVVVLLLLLPGWLAAQDPVSIVTTGVTKVIKAIDLQVQRMQTQTIWLEEAQKVVENAMTAADLDAIRGWVEDQKDLYGEYFEELREVKTVIAYTHSIAEIVDLQEKILTSYRQMFGLFSADTHFSAAELAHMSAVYSGMIGESGDVLSNLTAVVTSFTASMSDAERLSVINRARDELERVYRDMQRFHNQNALLALQRGADADEIVFLKKMYGL